MKKVIVVLGVALMFVFPSFAQETAPANNRLGVDTAQQRLTEISVAKFEDPGFWTVRMPLDHGVLSHRRFEGSPLGKRPLEGAAEAGVEEPDLYVLGVRVDYFRRGWTEISVEPVRPLAVPGIAKTISVWVVGRNFNHLLKVVIEDDFGTRVALPMGRMNFSGWKELTVAIPPTIQQRNANYSDRGGIRILGFIIEPSMTETYGTYYVYFDDLRVVTDLFAEENRDPDDMYDAW
ncbi:MAG: flagellar filament protein FlaA [Spirochaetales bacterium]|nr:flagellar filament protein FlaA [Spirochaetales bacterium]